MKESGRRIRRTIGTAFFLCAALSAPVYAGRWQKGSGKDKGKWWYNDLNGSYKKGGWFWIDGNDDGMAECYYFDKKGWLQVSKTIDGSRVNESGAWVKGGVVQLKSSAENGISTNKNEMSTGTIDLSSDMDLGTEIAELVEEKGEVFEAEDLNPSQNSQKKSENEKKTEKEKKSSESLNFKGKVGSSAGDLPKSGATEMIRFAREYIGVLSYKMGGTSLTEGADCSGFTQQVFRHFGIKIPRDSRSQYAASKKVSVEELKPGDLIFYGDSPTTIYHVGIYSGNGTVIHCTHTGDYVRENEISFAKVYGYGRYE